MPFPTWDESWERPDPLRGRFGWTLSDYVNLGVALGLVLISLVLVMPAVVKAHDRNTYYRWKNAQRERDFDQLTQERGM